MITVHNRSVSREQLLALPTQHRALRPIGQSAHRLYAVCLNDPLLTVAIVEWLRELGQSVLLLHGGLPFEAARELAIAAGCSGLVHTDLEQYCPLPGRAAFVSASAAASGEDAPSLYQYSSGTTGKPKLIGRTWKAVEAEIRRYNDALARGGLADARPIVLASTAHSYGLITGIFAAWDRGVHPVIPGQLQPKLIVNSIRETREHLLYAVPTMLHSLADMLEAAAVRLHAAVTSGAPMPRGLFERCRPLSALLVQQYGCTEAGCGSLAGGMETHDDLGHPLPGVEAEAPGTEGAPAEIAVRVNGGPRIRTGDLGFAAASGRLRFTARMDDLINVSGLKVSPLEVEEVIARMPGIVEVVVYKGVHPQGGDRVAVLAQADESVSEERIREWCAKHLPPYKVPAEIRIVEAIPRTWTGKISRRLAAQGGA